MSLRCCILWLLYGLAKGLLKKLMAHVSGLLNYSLEEPAVNEEWQCILIFGMNAEGVG
jgi:hypothetical protein